jgi:hypothetical protein
MYIWLVDRYGFDPDLYAGTGGNNLAIQLVILTIFVISSTAIPLLLADEH